MADFPSSLQSVSAPAEVDLSVIVASYNSEKTIAGCLASLKGQKTEKSFEVILIESGEDGTGQLVEREFPQVRFFRFPERKFPGEARNLGVAVAKGKIIAFLDADCRAAEDWVEEILRAHEFPLPAIGGAIGNGNPGSYVGWAAYFCEFCQWMPGTREGWTDDIAEANMSYKRDVFQKYGSYLPGIYCSDTEFHWRLVRNGERLHFCPAIRVVHCNIEIMGKFLRHEYFHGRSFARMRVRARGFSHLKRMIYVLLSPLVFAKLFCRSVYINMTNRAYLLHYLGALPLFVLGLVCWSTGETIGYAVGYDSPVRGKV